MMLGPLPKKKKKKALLVPRRGYRKGISDRHDPKSRVIHTRLTQPSYDALQSEAASRGITPAKLMRAIVDAHLHHQRTQLPHNNGLTTEFLRTFARLGNNLNQLARQANTGLVTVSDRELRQTLDELRQLAKTLSA